ncbi:MlaD family protein [Streptomyces daliensis]|uniref:MCE family protein n=1 Tax=Streptomyces daliensis TaxID=299421 RepID=A0A8T4ITW9_9ACTN|nr:MCE family protein [Streptomyces daliensis]
MRRVITAVTGLASALCVLTGLTMVAGGSLSPTFDGVEDVPLPGGARLGDRPYEITAEFQDVLSLFPQSAVKVNDVAVGEVTGIELADNGWQAEVTMRVNGDVRLPANVYANLEQSSLLGEKYVQLVAPGGTGTAGDAGGHEGIGTGDTGDTGDTEEKAASATVSEAPRGRLRDGSVIPRSRTNRYPEVEEVFGALSMLLNGGGVAQLRDITRELNTALSGNETEVRSMLRRVNKLTTSLDDNKESITDAIDGVDKLSSRLAARDRKIGAVLDDLEPGLDVLKDQRASLVTMLRSLDTLSEVAVGTVERTKEDLVADLKALAPTLRKLGEAGSALPNSLEVMATYPFTDEVLSGVKGDYLNVYLRTTARPGTEVVPPLSDGATGSGSGGDSALPLPPADGGNG